MRQVQAQEIMSTPVVAVRAGDPIPDVVRTLRRHGISGAPVLDEFGLMCGVISEGDIVAKEAGPGGLSSLDYARDPYGHGPDTAVGRQIGRRAAEVMTKPVVSAREDARVAEIASLMVRHQINRVPIVRGEELVGIVTRADILSLFDRPPAVLLAEVRTAIRTDLITNLAFERDQSQRELF